MNVRIEIDTKTFVRFWLVVIGFALAAYAIYSARTAIVIIGSAFFLAMALNPPVNKLAKILPSRSRVLSTALSYVVVVLTLCMFIFLAVPPIIEQTVKFAQNVPDLIDSATKQYGGINEFIQQNHLQPEFDKIVNSVKNGAAKFTTDMGSFLINGISSVLSVITAGILVLVLAFLMLVEGPDWLKKIWGSYSNKKEMDRHRKTVGRMYNVVTGYVVGQLSVSAIAGLVAGFVVFILAVIFGAPTNLAVPSAVIVLLGSLIPLFGAMIGAFIVGFVLALNSVTAAIAFILFFILYQQLEANYISPKIQSKHMDLSAMFILIAVTVGIYVFGVAGGIISIPIAGCVKVILEDYFLIDRKPKLNIEEKLLSL